MQLPTLSTLSPRRLAGAVAAACAAALIPVAALAAPASPAAPAAPACSTGGLVVWINNVEGAAGTLYYTLNFTNLSGHACTLRGHPGVSTVGLSGSQIGRPARWGDPGHVQLRTVRLARGATATAVLAVTNVYNFPANVCHRVTAAGLRVYPPNQFTSTLVPYPIGACSTRQVFMTAGVVQKQK
ncbi:MAG TPA: DUF4232 domain-containing protein [Streptosporangiaceae bacterium]|nr:DUF4232 domain-containing protein [Streptosporangiaceae bacterium]